MFTIAHLTDTHFGNRPGVAERNRRVVEAVVRLAPDVVIVTGDVADHGTAEEYAEAREVLGALPGPVLWCPGNHDVREAFASAVFGDPVHGAAGLRPRRRRVPVPDAGLAGARPRRPPGRPR